MSTHPDEKPTSPLHPQVSGEEVRVFFRSRLIFRHSPSSPGFDYGHGEGVYRVNRGNFRISEKNRRVWPAGNGKVERASTTEVILRFLGSPGVELRFTAEDGRVSLIPAGFPEGTNRFILRLPLDPAEGVYGCGEQFSRFNLRGSRVPLWSEEQGVGRSPWDPLTHYMNWKHGAGGHWYSTYFPQPTFLTSDALFFHAESRGYALFDFRPSREAVLEFWELPPRLHVGVEPDAKGAVAELSRLLGRMQPLPDWTYNGMWIGAQGGREAVEAKLRDALSAGVRVGALWVQDWEGRRITSFGKQLFWNWEYHREMYPDLPGYIKTLREREIRFLGYINTFLALEGNLYKEAAAKNYCVKDRGGKDYYVYITTFPAAIVDLTNPEARQWIKGVIQRNMLGIGLSGWMADFGEYLPTDAVLASGEPAELWHNPWPALWALVNREAVEEAGALQDTVFFLRAGFTGTSRYGRAVWAGDQLVNFSRHDGLPSVIPAALSLGVCGTAIHHSDIGGYTTLAWVHRKRELFQRWAEMAAFGPIMRTHEGNRPDSNHQFNSDAETLTHLARVTRVFCHLKPYHQALQGEHVATGLPLYRPLFLHYPGDPGAYPLQYQYLYGPDLLVAPVLRKGAAKWKVYLPPDEWVHLWSGRAFGTEVGRRSGPTENTHSETNSLPSGSLGMDAELKYVPLGKAAKARGRWVEVGAPLGYPPVFYRKGSPWTGLFEELKGI